MINRNKLYGAILGDLAGQPYEFNNEQGIYPVKCNLHNEASKITDDTIMTLASARSIFCNSDIEHEYKYWGNRYASCGFGKSFTKWLKTPPNTIAHSWGNGSVMRISPFLWLNDEDAARDSINTSHRHVDSYVAADLLIALYDDLEIVDYKYPAKWEHFEVNSIKTMLFVRDVFMSTSSTHEAIQLAVSLGGDTDTTASIVGELSNHHRNDLTEEDIKFVESKLDLFQLQTLSNFNLM